MVYIPNLSMIKRGLTTIVSPPRIIQYERERGRTSKADKVVLVTKRTRRLRGHWKSRVGDDGPRIWKDPRTCVGCGRGEWVTIRITEQNPVLLAGAR